MSTTMPYNKKWERLWQIELLLPSIPELAISSDPDKLIKSALKKIREILKDGDKLH